MINNNQINIGLEVNKSPEIKVQTFRIFIFYNMLTIRVTWHFFLDLWLVFDLVRHNKSLLTSRLQ